MSNFTRWYREGAVSATNGNSIITGTNTYWKTAGLHPGDILKLGGTDYEIVTIIDDTHLTISPAFAGVAGNDKAYSIIRNFTSTMQAEIASNTAELLGDFRRYVDSDMQTIHGKSAYEIACANGFVGTEAQWLSSLIGAGEWDTLNKRTEVLSYASAGLHNSIFRGKNLGNAFTEAQSAAIRAGTFGGTYGGVYADVYSGDYWIFSNIPYTYLNENDEEKSSTYSGRMRVADCDYYLRAGDTELTAHHIVVVPDTKMFTAPMNETDTTEGGYVGSKMRTVYLRRAEAIFKACFGENHVLTHREHLVGAVRDGWPSGGVWCDSVVELMDERMVYGSLIFDSGNPDGTNIPNRYSISCKQLSLFQHRPDLISNRQWYWLRNVVSAARFAYVNSNGFCDTTGASYAGGGVRPAALIY